MREIDLTYDVEAVDVAFVDPALHFVCDFSGCTYACRAETADCKALSANIRKPTIYQQPQLDIPIICCASVFFVHFPPFKSGADLIKFRIYPWMALLFTYFSSSSSP